jgi:hypothetical protein
MDGWVWPWIVIDGSEWIESGGRGQQAEGKSDKSEREKHGGMGLHRTRIPTYIEPLLRYASLPIYVGYQ